MIQLDHFWVSSYALGAQSAFPSMGNEQMTPCGLDPHDNLSSRHFKL